ncbi:MAG: sulfatase-like hydrolase/transferase [Chloroflexota bacterium]
MGLTHPPFCWDLGPREQHVAGILGQAGYETHLFGFQHVTTRLDRLGFHTAPTACAESGDGNALGCTVAQQVADFLGKPMSNRPLYMEVNLEEPHRPFDQGGAVPDDGKGVFVPSYLPDDSASREEMAALQGAIRQADAAVGKILALVDGAGLRKNTLVVLMADHGIAMPRAKCTLYDSGIEVALIVRWPEAGLDSGRVYSEMVSNLDVLPTMLENTPPDPLFGAERARTAQSL